MERIQIDRTFSHGQDYVLYRIQDLDGIQDYKLYWIQDTGIHTIPDTLTRQNTGI